MKRTLFAFFILLAPIFVKAQSAVDVRKVKSAALQVFEKYVSAIQGIYDPTSTYAEDDFIALFEEEAILYNDILPANTPQNVSPQEYYDKSKSVKRNNLTIYTDLSITFPELNNDGWLVRCCFSKTNIYITTQNRVYPPWKFNYIITIQVYNGANRKAKILKVEVVEPISEFYILKKQNLMVGGDTISWGNDSCRIFPAEQHSINEYIPIDNEYSNFFSKNVSSWIKDDIDPHYYCYQRNYLRHDLVGAGINYNPVSIGNKMSRTNAKRFVDISSHNGSVSYYIFWAKQIYSKKSSTLFFDLGLDLNHYYFKYQGKDYIEYTAIDSDAESYLRKIRINSLNEKVNTYSFSLPFGILLFQQIFEWKNHSFFIKAGIGGYAEFYLKSISRYHIDANYHGYYDYYGGVEFDHYYDYGDFYSEGKQKLLGVKDSHFDFGLTAQIGLHLSITPKYLIGLDLIYKHGFNAPLEYQELIAISEKRNMYNSLLHCTNQGIRNIYLGLSFATIINEIKPVKRNK